jgi:ParB family transcriptional regulator, chromosome partitioning protein
MPDDEIQHVPLEKIDPCVYQSRERFDEAEDRQLADDITTNGQLQAGVAWFDPGRGRYVLIIGERRFRALKIAGKPTMALAIVRGSLTPGQMLQKNLAENIQRASLNPIERGKAFRRLMQLEDLNASEVALRMNVSNAMVSRDLSLLDLPDSLQARVATGELPASVGAAIARVGDDETRRALADQYGGGTVNRDGIVIEVNRLLNPQQKPARKPRLALKLGGLSISVTAGKPEKLNFENLLTVLGRVCKEAKSLKDGGRTDVAELSEVLRA